MIKSRLKSMDDGIPSGIEASCSVATVCLLLLLCVVPSGSPPPTFHFELAGRDDTIAPWGEIGIVFSEPIVDSCSIGFIFEPPFYSYAVIISGARDTIKLRFTGSLQGNTRYVLRLKETVFSQNGAKIDPSNDSVVFFTYPAEQEPNGKISIADTLRGRCFGTITTTDDTDMYVVTDTSAYAVFLNSIGSQSTFTLKDDNDSITGTRSFRFNDTLMIPDKFRPPLLMVVYSYYRSVGGYYEIGFVCRQKTGADKK